MRAVVALVAWNLGHGPARLGWLATLAAAALVTAARIDLWLAPLGLMPGFVEVTGVLAAAVVAIAAGVLPALAATEMSLSADGLQVLEPYPLRRAHAFFADLLAAAFTALPALMVLALYPTAAEAEAMLGSRVRAFYQDYFPARGTVLALGGGIALLALGSTVLARVASARRPSLWMAAATVGFFAFVLPLLLFDLWAIAPRPSGLAWIQALTGLGALVASLWLFVHAPIHIDGGKRADRLGTLAVLALLAFSALVAMGAALRWKELTPDDGATVRVRGVLSGTRPEQLLLVARSERSGTHHVLVDLASRSWTDLGRGLDDGLPHAAYADRTAVLLRGGCGWLGLASAPSAPLLELDPARPRLRRIRDTVTSSGDRSIRLTATARIQDGRLAGLEQDCPANGPRRCRTSLVVLDRSGEEQARFPLAGGKALTADEAEFSLFIAENRVLAWTTARSEEPEHLLLDLATLAPRRFRLPGRRVGLASDLGRAAFVRRRDVGRRRRDSLVVVELPSLEERVVLGEEVMPGEPLLEIPASEAAREADRVEFLFDAQLARGVWLEQRIEGGAHTYTLHAVEVEGGPGCVLMSAAELPRLPLLERGDPGSPALVAIAADGSAVSLRVPGRLLRVDLDDGRQTTLAAWPFALGPPPSLEPSPDLLTAAWSTEVGAAVHWLDERRLLTLGPEGGVVLLDPSSGGAPREVFPAWTERRASGPSP